MRFKVAVSLLLDKSRGSLLFSFGKNKTKTGYESIDQLLKKLS